MAFILLICWSRFLHIIINVFPSRPGGRSYSIYEMLKSASIKIINGSNVALFLKYTINKRATQRIMLNNIGKRAKVNYRKDKF
ncbi:hypothetical protein F4212_02230 [Candidatus Poribacteria bacterium]|nr:hypothetical protein [Candidatus Poribacteria bacterium]